MRSFAWLLLAACTVTGGPSSFAAAPPAFRDCDDCPQMLSIPGGSFTMGAARGEEEREKLADEFRERSQPLRRVDVKRFAIGKFEVTRGEYRVFADATGRKADGCFVWVADFELEPARSWRDPGFAQDDRHPVTCVSWNDATAYAVWLSQKTGRNYRLPSEAEWEYAARAGTTTSRYWGDDPDLACEFANGGDRTSAAQIDFAKNWGAAACSDGHAYTAPVGAYHANAFGLHDMLGNVEEWTQDCWNADYKGAEANSNARTSGDCSQRAVRGGSWIDAPLGLRAAYRVGSPTVIRVYRRGFRVARDE
jgi:formylglycine-generating enzyme required for sulfatase activity